MNMADHFKKQQEVSEKIAIADNCLAREKAAIDMDAMTSDFFNPAIETNPYKRGYESHMAEAYSEERLLLIEEWSRANGH